MVWPQRGSSSNEQLDTWPRFRNASAVSQHKINQPKTPNAERNELMNTALVDSNKPWVIASGEISMTLEIVLLKRTVVLSWNQFVFAEGSDDEVQIAFATHDVIIRGVGLTVLIADVSAQVRGVVRSTYE